MTKMKKMFTWCITVAMLAVSLCFPLQASALTEGDWEFQLLDGEAMITGYIGKGGDVEIPEQLFGATVTELERGIFDYEDKQIITSLKIPGTIKKIPGTFCEGAINLSSVELSEGLEEISYSAFHNTSITKVILPSTLKVIDDWAFEYSLLTSVNLHGGLTKIGNNAFGHTALMEIDLSKLSPDCDLVFAPFGGCSLLTKVKWGRQTVLADHMFDGCSSLSQIILPTTLQTIGHEAFSETNLKEVVIPYGVTKIEGAFIDCPNLKSLYIPDTVTDLSEYVIMETPNCIIYCSSDSHAAKVCKEHKISYITDKSVNSLITVLYNDTRISFHTYDQNPELINDRTLVPLRSIFEAMGATVTWDAENRTAIATRKGITVKIKIDANAMDKNGTSIPMDVPAQLINDRTMVPVRVIAEAFGADVEWNGNGRTVLINE